MHKATEGTVCLISVNCVSMMQCCLHRQKKVGLVYFRSFDCAPDGWAAGTLVISRSSLNLGRLSDFYPHKHTCTHCRTPGM